MQASDAPSPAPTGAPRFHVSVPLHPGATLSLDAATARHIQALRLRRGDQIALFNGDGCEYLGELIDVGRRAPVVLIRSGAPLDRESRLPIILAQGVCAADRMDLVIQKATELGVARIIPIVASRSIVRLSDERQERREAHWQKVAIAACEQCRRNRVPQVDAAIRFDAFMADPPQAHLRLVLSGDGTHRVADLPRPESVLLFIGPEGGLAREERELLADRAFVPVRFGPRVLRTETAPIAAIASMQAIWGDC